MAKKFGTKLIQVPGAAKVDLAALYRHELTMRGRSIDTKKRRRRAQAPKRGEAQKNGSSAWLQTAFTIHDPQLVSRELGRAIARRYPDVQWSTRLRRGEGLQLAQRWPNRTARVRQEIADENAALRRLGIPDGLPLWKTLSEVRESAAEAWGLSTTNLRRLLSGEAKSTWWLFAEKLRKHLRQDEWRRLERGLFSPRVRKEKRAYEQFIDTEIERLTYGRSAKLSTYYTDGERTLIERFRGKAKAVGAPASRAELALLRVFEPFVIWPPSAKSLRERPDRRHQIVRRGLKTELELIRLEMQLLRSAASRLGQA